MDIKTPEQIAEQVADAAVIDWDEAYDVALAAIEADRAQQDIAYARQLVKRCGGRGVIWSREDIEAVLDERIKDGNVAQPATPEEYRAIVDRATLSADWQGLDNCSDRDWELVWSALDDAINHNS